MTKTKKLKQFVLNRKRWIIGSVVAGLVLLVIPTVTVNWMTHGERYNFGQVHDMPEREVAIVFGAGVWPDGTLTPYLRNRVETAVAIYQAGKVQKILMSGDNGAEHYNESEAMKRHAVSLGILEQDIAVDYAGFSTYDSCYRAKHIFGVTSATLVTQGYHLPRAVMTCGALGIDTVGAGAAREGRDFTVGYIMREHLSTIKALFEVTLKPSPTVLGNPEDMQLKNP